MQKSFWLWLLLSCWLLAFQAQAQTRSEALDWLQNWRRLTSERQDLIEQEKDMRLQFISRLLFQTERSYQTPDQAPDSHLFFQKLVRNKTLTEPRQPPSSLDSMDLFQETLSQAMKELLEPKENPLLFIESFTDFSGISEPASLEEFADTRSYWDGLHQLSAQPLDAETASQMIEARLTGVRHWLD